MSWTSNDLARMGLYAAIFMIMGFIPYLGFIAIGPLSITTLFVPFFLIIFLHKTLQYACFAGFMFGLTSFLIALLRPLAPGDIYFINPLVSILPRLLFGVFTWALLKLVIRYIPKQRWIYGSAIIVIVVSSLFHSALVLMMFFLFASHDLGQDVAKILSLVLSFNFVIEIALSLLTIPALYKRIRLDRFAYRTTK